MPLSSSSSSYYYYYFFHCATGKCGHFIGKKLHSFSSYVFLHVCDLFSHAYVIVHMYFEAVLLLVGSLTKLAIDVLT